MLQAKSAQKRQTAIPLKRRNPVDGTLVIILIMLLLAGLLVLFSATFYTGTSTRSPYSEVLKQLLGIGLGTAACIVTSRIPYRCWQHPYVVVGGLALSAVLLVLLFALPLLGGTSTLHLIPPVESRSYIDMTRAVQHAFGVESRWLDENTLEIPGGQHYLPGDYTVEGDYSQAAFPAVLGAVTGGVAITGLSEETLQGDAAILEILRRCGARFTRTGQGVVFEKAPLHGTDIDLADCPDLGPVLMVLGLLCEGTTVIRNAERLRIKESDRIEAMETELRACGGQLESEGGTITIHGCAGALHVPEQPLSGHNDHRVVMSLAVLALAAGLTLPISGAEAIAKSWPDFLEAIKPLGAEVEHVG